MLDAAKNKNAVKILKSWRKRNSFSIYKLANLSGISRAHLGKIESGTQRITYRVACRIASVTGIAATKLVQE